MHDLSVPTVIIVFPIRDNLTVQCTTSYDDNKFLTNDIPETSMTSESAPPSRATDAVLVASDPVSDDVRQVSGLDWNAMTAEQCTHIASFVEKLSGQGFQSSSIGDAVRIINEMVRLL